jgi:uncharacterized protein YndB with AHSA1/START domain
MSFRRRGKGNPVARQQTAGSYQFEVLIEAPPARVWQALVTESVAWWPKEFHTSERTKRFVIEPVLGGRVFEDFGGGDGLVWYSVVGVEAGRELILAGHLLPPFGGPAVTALRLTLSAKGSGTLLRVQDDRFGSLGGESPVEGWRLVFDNALRRHIESGEKTE